MTQVVSTTTVFDRILCAVDESRESLAAVSQATLLAAPEGSLELVAVAETFRASHAGWSSASVAAQIDREASEALARAAELSPGAARHLARGHAASVLLHASRSSAATLVAVGATIPSHTRDRLLGSVAEDVVRQANCSVLVARRRSNPRPLRIVCGIDGSSDSLRARAVAEELCRRFGSELDLVAASGGKGLATEGLDGEVRLDSRRPVDALTDAALDADLVVVGNRGLHGILSLGSVSARVAARSACSVLVVRAS